MAPVAKPVRLGDYLVRAGFITENQLKLALAEQKRVSGPLGRILVNLGFITEEVLARSLAEQMNIPFLSLSEEEFDPELVRSVPPELARKHSFVPVRREADGTVLVAMANPADVLSVDAIQDFFGTSVSVAAALDSAISSTITRMMERDASWEDDLLSAGAEDEGPTIVLGVTETVDRIMEQALRDQATDIHLEPEEQLLRVRFRIDGVLHQEGTFSKDMTSALLTRFKILAGMDITERRLPQDGRITLDRKGTKVDLRVSTMPTNHGENMVIRVLDRGSIALDLKELGVPRGIRETLHAMAERPYGMILVSGPTGSGKTTTLYALLLTLDAMTKKIVTVEDPIEYELPLIRQSQVDPDIGYTFAGGLRTILRQDPDVILVGEIRDRETAETAMRAALTGHVVLSSIHTNTAVGAVPRLRDIGIDPFLITASLSGVIAQRLVRRVCPECRVPYAPGEEERRWLGTEEEDLTVFRARGCPSCRHTGYLRRSALFELFSMDDDFTPLVARGAGEKEMEALAREKGQASMMDDGRRKVLQGITTMQEVLRICLQR